MFEIGFSELLIIAVVALIVLGPERLPRAAQLVGLWVRKARAHWFSMKAELERELAADELKRSLRGSGEEIERELRGASDATRAALSQEASATAASTTGASTTESKPAEPAPPAAPDRGVRDDDTHDDGRLDDSRRDNDKPAAP